MREIKAKTERVGRDLIRVSIPQHYPEPTLEEQERIMKDGLYRIKHELDELEDRMQMLVDDYGLCRSPEQIFKGFDLVRLRHVAIPIQSMFTRCGLLLSVYDVNMRQAAKTFGLAKMSEETQELYMKEKKKIHIMRTFYVDAVGPIVLNVFQERLQAELIVPGQDKFNDLDDFLYKYFGFGRVQGNPKSPVMKDLEAFFTDVGAITGMKKEAKALLKALKNLD